MTPQEHYQAAIKTRQFKPDPAQLQVVEETQRLYEHLLTSNQTRGFFARFSRKKQTIKGLYLFGGTGRGKTWLVDSFYACLPFPDKFRCHFHAFMDDIHHQLQQLPKTPNPLKIIADNLSDKFRLLCLDEFHVHDIGDAMVMAGLLEAMFERGITLVTTSNIAINDLYLNGLQRDLFLPTLALLKENTLELDLEQGTDFRFQAIESLHRYRVTDKKQGDIFLQQQMQRLSPCTPKTHRQITINHRPIDYIAMADDIIWLEYSAICETSRADSDYIKIAKQFNTVLLANIPIIDEDHDNTCKRFIHLIDALYDHHVKVIITAAASPNELYTGHNLKFAFDRTISRLIEMDSPQYFSSRHQPDPAEYQPPESL